VNDLIDWLVGWLVGWLAGWLVGWLAGWPAITYLPFSLTSVNSTVIINVKDNVNRIFALCLVKQIRF